MKRSFLK